MASTTVPAHRDADRVAFFELAASAGRGRMSSDALRALAQDPRRVVGAARYALSLPWMSVCASDSPAGMRVRARVRAGRRWLSGSVRLAQPVLTIPATEAAYLTGNRRQTVRKNARKAAREGYRCRVLSVEEAMEQHNLGVDEGRIVAVTEASHGSWSAITVASFDGEWAILEGFLKRGGGETPSSARYLLHVYLMECLRQAGARYLIATRIGPDRPGLQYFQHIVGFAPTNLRLVSRRRREPDSKALGSRMQELLKPIGE